ncbi:MAG: hypothetical protein R2845_04850 [Thermomicrobiales bacterium]
MASICFRISIAISLALLYIDLDAGTKQFVFEGRLDIDSFTISPDRRVGGSGGQQAAGTLNLVPLAGGDPGGDRRAGGRGRSLQLVARFAIGRVRNVDDRGVPRPSIWPILPARAGSSPMATPPTSRPMLTGRSAFRSFDGRTIYGFFLKPERWTVPGCLWKSMAGPKDNGNSATPWQETRSIPCFDRDRRTDAERPRQRLWKGVLPPR